MSRLPVVDLPVINLLLRCSLLAALVVMGACSGDARPFEESIEVSQQELATLSVHPPANEVASFVDDAGEPQVFPLFVDVGQQLQFSIRGVNAAGEQFTMSGIDRTWVVSNPEVASMSANGLLTSLSEGVASIGVSIGGIDSTFYTVNVRNSSIDTIAGIYGDPSAERCLAEPYTALGLFLDGSTRVLDNVEWTVSDPESAFTKNQVANTIDLVAIETGSIDLIANVDGAQSLARSVVVNDSLTKIEITPSEPRVRVGETLSTTALGVYSINSNELRFAITSNVVWEMPENNGAASVSNATTTAGLVSGINEGSTILSAQCGMNGVVAQVPVEVVANPNLQGLAFQQSSPVSLSLATGTYELAVSTGSSYNSTYDVSTKTATTWEVTSGTNVVSINKGSDEVTISLLSVGDATVQVNYGNYSATITISVK